MPQQCQFAAQPLELVEHRGAGAAYLQIDRYVTIITSKMSKHPSTLISRYFRGAEFGDLNEAIGVASGHMNNRAISIVRRAVSRIASNRIYTIADGLFPDLQCCLLGRALDHPGRGPLVGHQIAVRQ